MMKRHLPIALLALAVPAIALAPLPDFWIAQLNYIGLYLSLIHISEPTSACMRWSPWVWCC